MEKEKRGNFCYIFLIIILLLVIGACIFLIYNQNKKMEEFYDEQDKICLTCECDEENKTNQEETSDDEQFKEYALKMIEGRSKYKDWEGSEQSETVYPFASSDTSNFYTVSLLADGTLKIYFSSSKESKTVSTNVLSFYVIYEGNGGWKYIYAIKEDGTVTKVDANQNLIVQDNYNNLKNIIQVLPGTYNDYSGVGHAIFVDINGNITM